MLADIVRSALLLLKKLVYFFRKNIFSRTTDGVFSTVFMLGDSCQKTFDPKKYIDPVKGIFIGLSNYGDPIFRPLQMIQKNHIAFIGESGCGKTMAATSILAQCAKHFDECSIIFDPKNDKYMLNTLHNYHDDSSKFHVLDLSPDAPPQINPFHGASAADVEMMLISALQLFNSGNSGVDFYRAEDRDAARLSADIIHNKKTCFPEFLSIAGSIKAISSKHAFWRDCQQLGFIPALQAHSGLSIADTIKPGNILYVIGNTSQPRVQAAIRLILQRVIQIAEKRDQQYCKSIGIFIDEIRYVLSEVMLTSLSTIRDKNVHLLIAFQDVGNLLEATCVNPKAVESIIMTNTSIKFVYRISHAQTLSTLEKISGCIYTKNIAIPRIPAGLISHLPKPQNSSHASVGIIFGDGPAYIVRCAPLHLSSCTDLNKIMINSHPRCNNGIYSPHDLI